MWNKLSNFKCRVCIVMLQYEIIYNDGQHSIVAVVNKNSKMYK